MFSVNVSYKEDTAKIAKTIQRTANKYLNKINHEGPKILRYALSDVLAMDERTAKYAAAVIPLKSELRPIKLSHRAGLKFRIENGDPVLRIAMTEAALGEAYWPLTILQYGRKALPAKTEGVYVMAMRPEDVTSGKSNSYAPLNYPSRPGYVGVFTKGPIRAIPALGYDWYGKAKKEAIKNLNAYIRSLK